jgi:hypothetical protein
LILANLEKPIAAIPSDLSADLISTLGRSLFSSIRAWGYLCAASVFLLMVDTHSYQGANWANSVVVALISLGAVRVSRAIYALSQLFDARAQASIDELP